MFWSKREKRYVARKLDMILLGVSTGVVDDTKPELPTAEVVSEWISYGKGFRYITTYSSAKRIARLANRADRKEFNENTSAVQ